MGFVSDMLDHTKCQDLNECQDNPNICSQQCVNTPGSYQCKCYDGYKLKVSDDTGFRECVDVNECESGLKPCGVNAQCRNVPGSFKCTCTNGYSYNRDTGQCVDLDECALGMSNCAELCVNTEGSYRCNCRRDQVELGDGDCVDCKWQGMTAWELTEDNCSKYAEICSSTDASSRVPYNVFSRNSARCVCGGGNGGVNEAVEDESLGLCGSVATESMQLDCNCPNEPVSQSLISPTTDRV